MTSFARLKNRLNTITDLGAAAAVLGWDQETYMPHGAVGVRAEQLATLSSLVHAMSTDAEMVALVDDVRAELSALPERERRVAETFIKDHERAVKLPASLVEEMARTASHAQEAWKRAKDASDFTLFQPLLEKIIRLKREESAILSTGGHPYDCLLDSFEPGLSVIELTPVFERLRVGTQDLLAELAAARSAVADDVLYRTYPKEMQLVFAKDIARALGFEFSTGRVDLSSHPFCTSFGSTDVRLTTRIRENDLRSCLFGLIHEAGHGMYEQGIGSDLVRTPSGQGASMGIHESQSLFWENVVARSEEFWQWAFPLLRDQFPEQLADQTPTSFYRAINRIQPSLNRVESDEVTYNLHIILRFEIERDLIDGILQVKDVPAAWNEKMKQSLGIVPPGDAEGCLQDVHWSFGGIGYFPSYTLGKLYAAMEWNAMQKDIPNVREQIANGNFASILLWLRNNIHSYGRTETPTEIIQRITGRTLTEADFLAYVGNKARAVYGL